MRRRNLQNTFNVQRTLFKPRSYRIFSIYVFPTILVLLWVIQLHFISSDKKTIIHHINLKNHQILYFDWDYNGKPIVYIRKWNQYFGKKIEIVASFWNICALICKNFSEYVPFCDRSHNNLKLNEDKRIVQRLKTMAQIITAIENTFRATSQSIPMQLLYN